MLDLHLRGWCGLLFATPVMCTPSLMVLHLGVSIELTKESGAADWPALLQAARICCLPRFLRGRADLPVAPAVGEVACDVGSLGRDR